MVRLARSSTVPCREGNLKLTRPSNLHTSRSILGDLFLASHHATYSMYDNMLEIKRPWSELTTIPDYELSFGSVSILRTISLY